MLKRIAFVFVACVVGCHYTPGAIDASSIGPDAADADGALADAADTGALADPDYREGFGKDATGGAGHPTCTVTSSAATGAGTLDSCMQPGNHATNKTIVFAVASVALPGTRYVGSNTTIDGCANGQNGVTFEGSTGAKRALVIQDPATNIVIRCLNFRGAGTPSSGVTEYDNLAIDATNGGAVSNVFIDRITSMQASDGALDLTGNVSNITVQRSLFYNNAITMLIKYRTRQNISLHHNVFAHNGERNPQIKGDMQLLDYVNNVVYKNDFPAYPDGTPTDPYGLRLWSASSTSESPGDVTANVTASALIGPGTRLNLIADTGATLSGVYIDTTGNYYGASSGPTSPKATPNAVPAAYAVTTLAITQLKSAMLPYVGAPNRTTLDQQIIADVMAALP